MKFGPKELVAGQDQMVVRKEGPCDPTPLCASPYPNVRLTPYRTSRSSQNNIAFQALVTEPRKTLVNGCPATAPRIWGKTTEMCFSYKAFIPSLSRLTSFYGMESHTYRSPLSHLHFLSKICPTSSGNHFYMSPFRGDSARAECNI